MIRGDKLCIICGDFNLRYQNEPRHFLINEILNMSFIQLIDHPTHKDGGIIDHVYLYRPTCYNDVIINAELFSPFYSDHYAISIEINLQNNDFLRMPSTIPDTLINNNAYVTKVTSTSKKQKKSDGSKRKACFSPNVIPKTKHKNQ